MALRPQLESEMTARSLRHQPFTIYDDNTESAAFEGDYEPRMSTSPSPYDADNGLSSDDSDLILPSVESQYPGARKSSAAFTSVSSLPPSLPYNSDISPYTPRKGTRPAFRSPSSVRAMQMSSPPPFQSSHSVRISSPLGGRKAKRGTPSSIRSGSVLHNVRHTQEYEESTTSHGNESGRGTPSVHHQPSPARGPLVLLHVTVLPSPGLPFSIESLQELAPRFVLQNWYLLQEQLTETVFSRGVLIPHPGEDFDLLEESLLETLGLCMPRIGSCGHFFGEDKGLDSDSGNDSGVSGVGRDQKQVVALGDKSQRWSTVSDTEDTCHDCERPIRLPGRGIGSGNTRWEVKVYASNGLMRAGAWFAAHKEMERVDVEIEPWIPEDVRRALDLRLEQEQEQARQEHEELEKLRFDLEVMERLRVEADDERARAEQRAKDLELDLESARAAIPPAFPAVLPASPAEKQLTVPRKRNKSNPPADQSHTQVNNTPSTSQEIPLSTLLRNYVILLAQDRRNVALGVLSLLVILLSLGLGSSGSVQAAASTTTTTATTAPLVDTMYSRFGSSMPENTRPSMRLGDGSDDNTDRLTWSSFDSPIDEAKTAPWSARSHSSLSIPPVSSIRTEEAAAGVTSSVTGPGPEEGAASVSHSSVLQESEGNPERDGATLSPPA